MTTSYYENMPIWLNIQMRSFKTQSPEARGFKDRRDMILLLEPENGIDPEILSTVKEYIKKHGKTPTQKQLTKMTNNQYDYVRRQLNLISKEIEC